MRGVFFFFFLPIHWSLLGKDNQYLLQAIPISPFPHSLQRKGNPAPAALAVGVGHFFLLFPIQPHPLIPLIMIETKLPYLETFQFKISFKRCGWSFGAMVLGKLPVPGRSTIWIRVGQGPTALAMGAGGVVWTFLLSTILSLFFLPLFRRRPDID